MRRTLILASIISIVIIISAATVFSQTGWRFARSQQQPQEESVTLKGTVTEIGRPTTILKTDDRDYILHLGPIWYQPGEEYPFEIGQKIELTGVVEEIYGKPHVYPHTIESRGDSVTLVDENNVPVWGRCSHGPGCGWCRHSQMSGQGSPGQRPQGQSRKSIRRRNCCW